MKKHIIFLLFLPLVVHSAQNFKEAKKQLIHLYKTDFTSGTFYCNWTFYLMVIKE